LYTTLPEKSKVLTSKDVTKITPNEPNISATTATGEVFEGSLIVGADGVHSMTRREMWRIADIEQPGRISPEEKRSEFTGNLSFNLPFSHF
jgi:FAD dependent monooxygenase